jgi:hypothetical protein
MVIVLVVGGAVVWWTSRLAEPAPSLSRGERENWRMPALALLERPRASLSRRVAMSVLGGYVVVAILLLAVKAVQIASGHH